MHQGSSQPRRTTGRRGPARGWLALALASLTLWGPMAQAAPASPPAALAAPAQSRPPVPSADEFLTGPDAADPLDIATRYLAAQRAALGLAAADLAEIEVTDRYVSQHTGVTHLYLRQRLGGIPVFNGVINVNVMPDGRILNLGNRFVPNLDASVNAKTPALTPIQALEALAAEKGLAAGRLAPINAPRDQRDTHLIDAPGLSLDPVPVRLMYQPLDQGGARLVWDAVIRTPDGDHWIDARIDALTGRTLAETDWVNDEHGAAGHETVTDAHLEPAANQAAPGLAPDEYRVFPLPAEHPNDTNLNRTMVTNPADALASPFGWHDTNGAAGAEFTVTRGNNAYAYTDTDVDNTPDPSSSPNGGPTLTFDFPLDLTTQEPADYRPAVVTNLFYMNNMIHDILYRYGFDEASGNFQVNNYGRGGLGVDSVQAEAQDGGGLVNANFFTPPDGQQPRMQMFLGGRPVSIQVTAPPVVAGQYGAGTAAFGPQSFTVSGQVVEVIDGTAPASDGCQAITNTIAGRIALLDRGNCDFVVKVKNAQNAGAIGVMVVNNQPGSAASMGGTDATITIPSLMISQADGARLRAELGNSLTLTLNRSGLQRDGSLDNAVIAHEYGHGLSNRLTGGPGNVSCLTAEEQAGEGWSDALALILTAKATDTATTKQTIGTWLTGQPANGGGFRQFPYTTDMAENPHTYDALKQPTLAVPHGVGSVWTAMVWEMYWNLVDEYGFDPNIYSGDGGNNLAFQLMVDGLKLQPCNPTFVEARDAILAADLAANDGVNRCAIWKGFAKRGLGFSARAGLATSRLDGTEAFDLPPLCAPDLGISLTRQPAGSLMPGQLVTYTLAFSNAGQLVSQSGIISAAISPLLTNIAITATGAPITPRAGILYGWDVSDLEYLEGGSVQISGVITPGLTADTTLVSSVAIGDPADPNIFNNGAVLSAPVTVPRASLAQTTLAVNETGGTATLTVTLSAAPLAPVRVRVATADGTAVAGSDYQALDTIVTIPAGATQAAVAVNLIDDSQPEPSESFTVTISPVAGASAAGATTVTISDGDIIRLYLPLLAKP